MILQLLLSEPLVALAWIVAILLALTIHEYAHAQVGSWRGDDTAERLGRLTINPLAHLDLLGTIMLITVGFGWAKPVPFDPRNLQHPLLDGMTIALAGPAANLFLAVLGGAAFRALATSEFFAGSLLPVFLILLIFINLLLLFFNLIPVPPLDGSKVLDAALVHGKAEKLLYYLHLYGPRVLLLLVIISLLTDINIFAFIQVPAIIACDALTGVSCFGTLAQ